ncbi:MAG: peptidase M61 [Sphingobacteriales bacterium]|nr:MAG: peptidase M61 [Sphingobacteriales bacterium]
MQKNLFLAVTTGILLTFSSLFAWAQVNNVYQYSMDLNKVSNDQLSVTLKVPEIKNDKATFRFPKIIPGTYSISDFGRFVSELKAFDKRGKALKVKKVDTNGWEISKANKLATITYKVDDTFDADLGNTPIYPMSGTNIQEGKNFILNTHGFFGFFENMENQPFRVEITKPAGFYGATGLIPQSNTNTKDVFVTDNYGLLVDSPIMYNLPDTTSVDIAGTQVLISVYAPNKMVTSEYLANNISLMLAAIKDYLQGDKLPVNKYAFLFYFVPIAESQPMQGALEHSYSSLYYLPEYPQEALLPFVIDVAAHEFFHIVTPLNLHSEEIHYFNFTQPKMSQHLWLYEGSTEYAASHVQVQYGLLDEATYFDKLRNKIVNATRHFNDTLPFTELSKGSLDKYKNQYQNVYEKGALISMCLDIKLLATSGGKYTLRRLIADLSSKYGKDRPFKDEDLFAEITAMTNPEIGRFFERYVLGNEPLPYAEIFSLVGIDYVDEETFSDFSIMGNATVGFNPETFRLYIRELDLTNAFSNQMGYQVNDELVNVNGKDIDLTDMETFFKEATADLKDGDTMRVVVIRNGEEVELSAPATRMDKKRYHQIRNTPNPTETQTAIRKMWLQAPQTND